MIASTARRSPRCAWRRGKAALAKPREDDWWRRPDDPDWLRRLRHGWLIPEHEPSVHDLHSLPHEGWANLNDHGCRVAVYGGEWQ